MEREYDIFETDGAGPVWRCSVHGHEAAIAKLKELAATSPNEFTIMHLPTKTVIATINNKGTASS